MTSVANQRFAEIVMPRLDEGYRLARWLTGSATDAEDVVQEACIKAYRAIETFTDINGRAWFLTIVRNSGHSWLAKHRPHVLAFIDDIADNENDAGHPLNASHLTGQKTPEDNLIAKDEAFRLASAIDLLPIHLRETLILREYNDLNYRDIASMTEVPIGTVMSRLARARQTLAALLKEEAR
ncbi:MAG: sigma-70 family RNA polymerase sigma factor [Neorhizobium sp.]|jgi:RNA polymerase sigma-70 factor (ECF subfamily)|nr:sigma-70 family RNA polymerase sigma factor [Neorhizobium sp.]